jgi:hypothetical protein
MPQWLQTVLVIAAVLAAIYLLAVIAQIILANIFRRQAEPVRASIAEAQRDVGEVQSQLEALAPAINGGTKEMPFGPLYDQARDLLKKGQAGANELQQRVAALAAQQIPEQPAAAAFKLAPMTREVAQRAGERKGARTVLVQLTEVNDTLTRIKHIQEDITAIPVREKDALLQLQKHAAEAAVAIEAEARPKLPLAEARDALRQANAYLGEADKLLADEHPPQPAVIIAHPLRLKADQQLQAADTLVGEIKDKRTVAEAAIAKSDGQLTALRAIITEEEAAGLPRPQFKGNADQLDSRAGAVKAMIAQGEYDMAAGALADLDQGIVAQQGALDSLKQARAQAQAMLDNASHRLATVTQWINEAPQTFDLDVTCAASQQLQDTADRLRSLIPYEDVAVMNTAPDLDRQTEDVFRRATNVHTEFLAGQRRFDELSTTLNEYSVPAAASQARQVASELGKANRAYWGDIAPDQIMLAADDLTAGWQSVSPLLVKIKESELTDVLARMDEVQTAYVAVSDLHGAAVKSLTQLDADKLQASTALNDDVMTRLLDEAETIIQASPSLAPIAEESVTRIARGRVEQLRGELAAPAPDYAAINANAQRLRQELDEFVGGYQARLQETHAQLDAVTTSLKGALGDLDALQSDAALDFGAQSEPVRASATAWLAANAQVNSSLDAAQAALTEGQAIEREAAALFGQTDGLRKHIADKRAAAHAALAEVNGALSAAHAGLQTLADVGGERWGAAMLDGARQPLTEALESLAKLEHPAPERKLTPDQMNDALARIESLTDAARQRANDTQAEIAQRAATIKQQQVALSHAYELADTVAKEHPERQTEWDGVRQGITQLEQRWMNASSYAEALEAMTQAVHKAEAFSALASASSA